MVVGSRAAPSKAANEWGLGVVVESWRRRRCRFRRRARLSGRPVGGAMQALRQAWQDFRLTHTFKEFVSMIAEQDAASPELLALQAEAKVCLTKGTVR